MSSTNTSPATTTVSTQTATTTTSSNPASSSSGPYLSIDTPFWIGDLGVGENKTLSLKVYTPAERVTQQPLPITIGYEANGKRASQTFNVGVKFIGHPFLSNPNCKSYSTSCISRKRRRENRY